MLLLLACASVEPSGGLFEPATSPPAAPSTAPSTGGTTAAPATDFPEEEPFRLTSEQMAEGTLPVATAAGVDAEKLPVPEGAEAIPTSALLGAPMSVPSAAAAPAPTGLPSSTWPARVLSTLPQAQPPRAILGLPDGSERVVSPGSMVPELGLVVMSVTAGRVGLAKVSPQGDHAAIESLELTAQYP